MSSWLSDLAKRGEAFLENVDQTAAMSKVALSNATSTTAAAQSQPHQAHQASSAAASSSSAPASPSSPSAPHPAAAAHKEKSLPADTADDDHDGTHSSHSNGGSHVVQQQQVKSKGRPGRAAEVTLSQSTSSPSLTALAQAFALPSSPLSLGLPSSSSSSSAAAAVAAPAQKEPSHVVPPSPTKGTAHHHDVEREMLQQEIETLNNEIRQYSHRIRKVEEDLAQSQKQLAQAQLKAQEHESNFERISQLLDTEKRKLQEKTQEAAALQKTVAAQREEIQRHQADTGKLQGDLQSAKAGDDFYKSETEKLRAQIAELQEALVEESRNSEATRRAFEAKMDKVREEVKLTLKTQEASFREKSEQVESLKRDLRQAEASLKATTQDFADYKAKAALALQTKEKIISDLKLQRGEVTNDAGMVSAEVLQLRRERDAAMLEVEEKQALIDDLRKQSQTMETQHLMEVEELKSRLEEFEISLMREKDANAELRQELSTLTQANAVSFRDADTRIRSLEKALQEKTQELQVMSHKLSDEMRKKSIGGDDRELEKKLVSMRDSLVEKQMQIEKLNMEKNSLLLRLETESNRNSGHPVSLPLGLADDRGSFEHSMRSRGTSSHNVLMGDIDRPKVPRTVQQAANFADLLMLKAVVFLRKFPAARISFLCYLIVLHIWIWTVLQYCSPSPSE